MLKLYSRGCEYALKALTNISLEKWDQGFLAAKICKKADVPESSTRKSFQLLVQKNILNAVSGPGGGYVLARAPSEISLLDIIKAIDGENVFDRCVMGLRNCGPDKPCPMHDTWKEVKQKMIDDMSAKKLDELITSAN